jgi:hypothetical protein
MPGGAWWFTSRADDDVARVMCESVSDAVIMRLLFLPSKVEDTRLLGVAEA